MLANQPSEVSQRNTHWQMYIVFTTTDCAKSQSHTIFFLSFVLIEITQFSLNIWLKPILLLCEHRQAASVFWSGVSWTQFSFDTTLSCELTTVWWISEQIPMFLWRVSLELNQTWLKYLVFDSHIIIYQCSVNKIALRQSMFCQIQDIHKI